MQIIAQTTPLVLSYDGTLRRFVRESCAHDGLVPADLREAIFYFDCPPLYLYSEMTAIAEMRETWQQNLSDEAKLAIYRELRQIVRVAQDQGRIEWRESREHPGEWFRLNRLLDNNHLPKIIPLDLDTPPTGRFSFPMVERAVAQQKLPYHVIF